MRSTRAPGRVLSYAARFGDPSRQVILAPLCSRQNQKNTDHERQCIHPEVSVGSNKYSTVMNPSQCPAIWRHLIGQELVRILRASEESEATANEWYDLAGSDLFHFAPGPVFVSFSDGTVIGLNSDASECAIICWKVITQSDDKLESWPSPNDFAYRMDGEVDRWVKSHVVRIESYREAPRSSHFRNLSRESALLLYLDNGECIAFVHGLHDNSDDFAVVSKDQIQQRFADGWERIGCWG